MMRKIPDYLPYTDNHIEGMTKTKDHYKVKAFNVPTTEIYIKVAQDEMKYILKFHLPEIPKKDTAAIVASYYAKGLIVRKLQLDKDYPAELAVMHHIENYFKSAVFNLRTIETIKPPLIIAGARVLQWYYSLPEYDISEREIRAARLLERKAKLGY